MKGYAVNDRLHRDQLGELRQLVQVVGRTLQHRNITDSTDGKELYPSVEKRAASGKKGEATWATILEKAIMKWNYIYQVNPDINGIAVNM